MNLPNFYKKVFDIEVSETENHELSYLGTPIINPITFQAGKYVVSDITGQTTSKRYADFRLPSSCIVDFSRQKIIGKTRINNNISTVKETFGFDDWKITIRGFCYNDPMQKQGFTSVIEQEHELLNWDEILEPIGVISKPFLDREIHYIAIERINFSRIRGNPNLLPFTINAISDQDFTLIENSLK